MKLHGNAHDLTGRQYGRLTVLEYLGDRKWLCRCQCGIEKPVQTLHLTRGDTRSCGCLHKEVSSARSGPVVESYIGKTIGYLTCEEYLGTRYKSKNRVFRFMCRCGNTVEAMFGSVKSCGCLLADSMREVRAKNQGIKNNALIGKTFKDRRVDAFLGTDDMGRQIYRLTCLHCQKEAVARHNPKWWGQCRCRIRRSPEQEKLYRMASRLRATFLVALRRKGITETRRGKFQHFGYTKEQLVAHIESMFLPRMTWENRSEWHIDHIVPLKEATTYEELIALFALSNLQVLWWRDNLSKGARPWAEWLAATRTSPERHQPATPA